MNFSRSLVSFIDDSEQRNFEETDLPEDKKPLNWFDEVDETEELPGPEYITYGCWVRVLNEKENKELTYHLPLKGDKTKKWYPIEIKMMGQKVGFKMFLSGKYYRVLEFGRD